MANYFKKFSKKSFYLLFVIIISISAISGVFCGTFFNPNDKITFQLKSAKKELKKVTIRRDELQREYDRMINRHQNDSPRADVINNSTSGDCWFYGFLILFFSGGYIIYDITRRNGMTSDERAIEDWGQVNMMMICPHCQQKGSVRTKQIKVKKGISGGKATAALLTGGVSLLATGLSQKENSTQAHCGCCGNVWVF